jgi:hypothetical protein
MTTWRDLCCDNCGDGCGWHFSIFLGWVACGDCNGDEHKPLPTGEAAIAKEIEGLTSQEELL